MEQCSYEQVLYCAWVLDQWFDEEYVIKALWNDTVGAFVFGEDLDGLREAMFVLKNGDGNP